MLDSNTIKLYSKQYEAESDIQLLERNVRSIGIRKTVFKKTVDRDDFFSFDCKLALTDVTDQKISGRCWIYAAMNIVNVVISNINSLSSIRLSENFIAFYDLLEKSNYFLEAMIENINLDIDDRLIWNFMQQPITDSGQWFFFQNIIEKYGIVTDNAMPSNRISDNTNEMIDVLSDLLKEFAIKLRMYYDMGYGIAELITKKDNMMFQVYRFLRMCLGKPPDIFSCELEKKNGDISEENGITPFDFYKKYIHNIDFNKEFCSVVNVPIKGKSFYRNYEVRYLGNVWNASSGKFLNIPMQLMKKYIIMQLKSGLPVWIACDSSVYLDNEKGIYSTESYKLEEYGFQGVILKKEYSLRFGLTKLRHAMTVVGVDFDRNQKPLKWLIKNSYGSKFGNNGYFAMTDDWFSLFVYQAVIKKELIFPSLHEKIEDKTIVLDPWDVLGNLAK